MTDSPERAAGDHHSVHGGAQHRQVALRFGEPDSDGGGPAGLARDLAHAAQRPSARLRSWPRRRSASPVRCVLVRARCRSSRCRHSAVPPRTRASRSPAAIWAGLGRPPGGTLPVGGLLPGGMGGSCEILRCNARNVASCFFAAASFSARSARVRVSFAIASRTVARFSAIVERASATSSRRASRTPICARRSAAGGASGVDGGDQSGVIEAGHHIACADTVAHSHGDRDEPLGLAEAGHRATVAGWERAFAGAGKGEGAGRRGRGDDGQRVDDTSGQLDVAAGRAAGEGERPHGKSRQRDMQGDGATGEQGRRGSSA